MSNIKALFEEHLPPCQLGDTFYAVAEDIDDPSIHDIYEDEIHGICLMRDGWYVLDRDENLWKIGTDDCILGRANAEKRLKELGGTV